MLAKRPSVGPIEGGIIYAVAVLIAAQAAAILGGLGPIFAVVALVYLWVLCVVYLMYRVTNRVASLNGASTANILAFDPGVDDASRSRIEILQDVDLFRKLSHGQLNRVVSLGRFFQVREGTVLARAGESRDYLFIIIEGKAQLSTHSAIGEITVRIAGPGEPFPLAALVGSETLITAANAMTDMELFAIPRSPLLALCSEEPQIGMLIYAAIAEALADRFINPLLCPTNSAEMSLKNPQFFVNL